MAKSAAKWSDALTLSAVVAGVLWPVMAELSWGIAPGISWQRLAILSVGPIVATAAACSELSNRRRLNFVAERFLAALGRADVHEIWQDDRGADLPSLAADHPWSPVLDLLRQAFREHGRKIQDLEQARAALELRCRRAVAENEQIRGILSGLPEPILAVDHFDDLVLVNSSAEQLFQLDSQNVATRAAKNLLRCQKLVDLLLAAAHHKTTGSRSEEIEIADAAGQSNWYRVTAARLGTEADSAAEPSGGAVAVLRNIADQKVLQKRNAEFVSSVSHEMKTPLAGIKAYVELLADGDAEDEATREEFLGVIGGQADRLQRLVENLLNLARIEAGVVKVSKEPQSLNAILEEALNVVQPSAESKNIRLTSDLSPLYLSVLADHDMLLQAAINLLSNAVKYTPPAGQVTLRSRMEEGRVRFEVQDTGVGLSPDDCQRVFEKFYRVDKNKNMASGTGLGLPLAKHIVEDVHGGQLRVESTLGQGSTFSVTLRTKD